MLRLFSTTSSSTSSTSKPRAVEQQGQQQQQRHRPTPTGHARVFYAEKKTSRKSNSRSSGRACTSTQRKITTTRRPPYFGHHTLTRTRSASDLIRAKAKEILTKQQAFDHADDDSSSDSSVDSFDEYGRVGTSLRSFHTEDEERATHFQKRITSLHEKEEELPSKVVPVEATTEKTEDQHIYVTSDIADTSDLHVDRRDTASTLPSQSNSHRSCNASGTGTATTPTSSAHSEAKASSSSPSSYHRLTIGSGTTPSECIESDVDLEYLLHENELLQQSLQDATSDRNRLAQENWTLRMELEKTRYQLQLSVMSNNANNLQSYPAVGTPPSSLYPVSSPSSYTSTTTTAGDYAYRGGHVSKTSITTFEELFNV
jgi:hypothetical protein